jgi:Hypervirulence associated proteins TUDOR domain
MAEFNRGDRVEWNFGRGKGIGKVQRRLTEPATIGGRKVRASKEDPRYVVKSEKSGKEAAHKASALRKLS